MSQLLDLTFCHQFFICRKKRVKIYLNRKDTKFPILNNGLHLRKYHNQGLEQNYRFKDVSQTDQVKKFLLAAVWTLGYTSVIICVASPTLIRCGWVFISARSVGNSISVKRLNILNTDLQSILQNIKNLQPAKQWSILTNTRSSRLHESCREFSEIFQKFQNTYIV